MGREQFRWTAKAAGGTDAQRFMYLLEGVHGRPRLVKGREIWLCGFGQESNALRTTDSHDLWFGNGDMLKGP